MRRATEKQRRFLQAVGLYPRPPGSGHLSRQEAWLLTRDYLAKQAEERRRDFESGVQYMDDLTPNGGDAPAWYLSGDPQPEDEQPWP